MEYIDFKEKIVEGLKKCGFKEPKAKEKANGCLGLYYDENNHPKPEECIKHILERTSPVEFSTRQLRLWKKEFKVNVRITDAFDYNMEADNMA